MDWTQPTAVLDVDLAFPARALEIMPPIEECEAGLGVLDPDERQKWIEFQKTWFFGGLPDTTQVVLRTNDGIVVLRTNDGIKVDGPTAFRHLSVIQGSFAPKHEHKEAAVAYLASLWFEDVSYDGFEIEEEDDAPAVQ